MFQGKIDEALQLIQNADPTGETQTDSTEMLRLENQCSRMGPLIDTELEKIDKSVLNLHAYHYCVIIRILWWNFCVWNFWVSVAHESTTRINYETSSLYTHRIIHDYGLIYPIYN